MYGHQIVNMLKAVDLMSSRTGISTIELAEKLHVSKRTVERLIAMLEELHFPIEKLKGCDGTKRWRLIDSYVLKLPNLHLPDIKLELSEIIALYLVRGAPILFQNTEIKEIADAAFAKLWFFLPQSFPQNLSRIQALFVPATKFIKDYKGKQPIIDGLRRAIVDQMQCRVTYHSFSTGKRKEYVINPLHFFEHEGGLYVFVNFEGYEDIRVLAVERIEQLEVSGKNFEYPRDFEPEKLLSSAFGIIFDQPFAVKVRFSSQVARYIKERTWAPNQRIVEDAEDGSLTIEMETSGWLDVKRWVLSYGKDAEVLEPAKMREEIAEELKQCLGRYASGGSIP